MKKALFIRLDRMGDLILTLPCDQLVAKDYQVQWVTPKGLDFVVQSASPKRDHHSFSRDYSWTQLRQFLKLIKEFKPDVAICFHVPWWIHFCLWFSRVPVRGGVLSQWHSYLFLNKGLRQKRSRCEHHEMEYNFLLSEYVFNLKLNRENWHPLELKEPNNLELAFDTKQNYFVVHPGMGGSALNWTTNRYIELISQLSEKATVVITGTKSDEMYLAPLKQALKENQKVVWLDKQLNGFQLLKLLKHAKALIAPSTGVLHLGASLGAPSLGIYSPIKVHQDKRWGPKGKQVFSYSPAVKCPAHFECLKEDCKDFDCMDQLAVGPIYNQAISFLESLDSN